MEPHKQLEKSVRLNHTPFKKIVLGIFGDMARKSFISPF